MPIRYFPFLTGICIIFAGFTYPQPSSPEPGSIPFEKDGQSFHSPRVTFSGLLPEVEEPKGEITLKDALSLSLIKSPELVAFSWEVRAKEARIIQVRVFPNPQLSLESENFGGSGPVQGFKSAENTLRISQLVELGRKRSKRIHLATLSHNLAGWDYEVKRLNVLTEVTKRFVEVLAAQERLTLSQELVQLADQVAYTVSERVKAGKVTPVEETRAKASLSISTIELERSERALESARQRLGYSYGSHSVEFSKAVGEIEQLSPIPSITQLVNQISKNPDIARWTDEIARRKARLMLAKSLRVPDLTVSGGTRRLNEVEANGFVLDLSLPLTLFDRNQGYVLESQYRITKAEQEQKASELRVLSGLAKAYENLSSAYSEGMLLKMDILPAVQDAFDAIIEGYHQGKFDYLHVLDAQRTLFRMKDRYITALASYHTAVADVEGIIGQSLNSVGESTEEN